MGLESGSFISDLVASNPTGGSDYVSSGDDHLRLIKSVLQNTFPNATRGFYFETVSSKTSNYTTTATDQNRLIKMDASGGSRVVSLLSAVTAGVGFKLAVEKTDNSANIVYLDGAGSQTIGGSATWALEEQYDTVYIISDGSNWVVLGSNISREVLNPTTVNATTVNADDFVGGNVNADDVSAATGTIASLQATSMICGSATFTGVVTINTLNLVSLNSTPIGNATPSSGAFTTLSASVSAAFSNTTITGTLGVSSAFSAGSVATGAISCSGITCSGTISGAFSGSLSGSSVSVSSVNTGSITAAGNGSVGGTFGVTGAVTLGSTLAVSGAATFSGAVGVTGNLDMQSDIRWYSGATKLAQVGGNTSTGTVAIDCDPDNVIADTNFNVNVDGARVLEIENGYLKVANYSSTSAIAANVAGNGQFWAKTSQSNTYQMEAVGDEVVLRMNRSGATHGSIMQFRRNGVAVGSIDVDGSTTTFTTTSDERLKENIVPLPSQWELVKQIGAYNFNFKTEPEVQRTGFIAQWLHQQVPEAVNVPAAEQDDEGAINYWGVDPSKLIPILLAALKEAQERIEDLEAKILG